MTCGCGLGRGARDREFFSTRSNPAEDPTLIAYRAMLDVPRELVLELAKLLRAERRARGTRKGTRLLTCFRQALLVLVWMRTKGEVEVIGAGFGVPRATAYRYRDEALTVLAAQAPDLHEALQEVAEQGWSHVVVDGKLIRTDRCAETTESMQGETINAWYSGETPRPRREHPSRHPPRRPADLGVRRRTRPPPRPHRGPRRRRHRRAELGRRPT